MTRNTISARAFALAAALLVAVGCADSAPPPPEDAGSTALRSRIGPPDSSEVAAFVGTGATEVAPHELSDEEWRVVGAALRELPELHRRILDRHLIRLSFLEVEGGLGNALTSRVGGEDSKDFTITLRASLLTQSLSDFLDAKEANLFAEDGSGYRIRFDAGSVDALTYVLLHEASHVVDQALGLTDDVSSPLMAGTWETARVPIEPYRSSPALQSRFRGAPQIPLAEAPRYYRALAETPFVSFYATAAAAEDVAELFAWQRIAEDLGDGLTLSVVDRTGGVVFRYAPLASPLVQARFRAVEGILAS